MSKERNRYDHERNHIAHHRTYHRLSLRVKEGYLVEIVVGETGELRLESCAMYFGSIVSMKMSGRKITNARPFGNHAMTSAETSLSFNIDCKSWGNVSLLGSPEEEGLLPAGVTFNTRLSPIDK